MKYRVLPAGVQLTLNTDEFCDLLDALYESYYASEHDPVDMQQGVPTRLGRMLVTFDDIADLLSED